MNRGGFSWRRLFGVSAAKARISRAIGIPLSRSGRRQKAGRAMGCAVWLAILTSMTVGLAAIGCQRMPPGARSSSTSRWVDLGETDRIRYSLDRESIVSDSGQTFRVWIREVSAGDSLVRGGKKLRRFGIDCERRRFQMGQLISYDSAGHAAAEAPDARAWVEAPPGSTGEHLVVASCTEIMAHHGR